MKALKRIFTFHAFLTTTTIVTVISVLLAYLAPFVHPSTFWILPFFGLAYPILIVLLLILLIIWAFKRSKWALVLFALFLLGLNNIWKFYALGGNNELGPNQLKVISNNVKLLGLYTSSSEEKFNVRDSIFNYIIAQNADVVCFQEFYQKDDPSNFETTTLFSRKFNPKATHDRMAYKPRGHQHFGVIMFSKHPIIAKGDVIYESGDERNYNYCIYADIVKNQDTFRIYNVHLQSNKLTQVDQLPDESNKVKRWLNQLKKAYPKRADQALRIVEHISHSPYPVVVCGDFNDPPISYSYQQFSKELSDGFLNAGSGIGATYVGRLPAGRIDYIFHSKSLKSNDFKIQAHPFSDHRAISCVISK